MHDGKSRWGRRASAVLLATLLMPLVGSSPPSDDSSCRKVHGKFVLQVTSGPDCPSPIGLCATGRFQGGISGTSFFVGSSRIPTTDTPTTSVVVMTGDNVIETRSGALKTKDAIVLKTTGAEEFAEVDTIVGGTGGFAGATGTLTATGTRTGNVVEGTYFGEVCTP